MKDMDGILGLQFATAEKYKDTLNTVAMLETAAGMNIESLTAMLLRGYTLKEPQEVTFEELEKPSTQPVKYKAINSFGTSIGACPNCWARVIRNYNENNCGRCGQNITWE